MLADRPQGRRLTADEQRQLEDLERRLLTDPPAHARPRPAGLAARVGTGLDVTLAVGGVVAAAAMLLVAVIIGGPGGATATAAALLATLLICRIPRGGHRLSPTGRWRGTWRMRLTRM
jgi:hypothetical protein